MKRFSRCVLILILVAILSGAVGYVYENKKIIPMYESTTQLYVVPGEENEASIRANNGGLKDDFTIIFKSNVVISAAQRIAGTSEDIAQYLTVSSPANSNIVEITCVNPDQNTAKKYVDAVAQTAIKTTSIIPVNSIQILSEGTSTGVSFKPDLYKKTGIVAGIASTACLFIEIIVCLFIGAFKSKDDDFNHEYEYERRFGHVDYIDHRPQLLETDNSRVQYTAYEEKADTGHVPADNNKYKKNLSAESVDNVDDNEESEDDILARIENEVSDYFKDDKDDKKDKKAKKDKKNKKHKKNKDVDDALNDDVMSDDITDETTDDTNDIIDKTTDDTNDITGETTDDITDGTTDDITDGTTDDIKNDIIDDAADDDIDIEFEENEPYKTDDDVEYDDNADMNSDDMNMVDKLSDEELKNIEIETQAAVTMEITDEDEVNKVMQETAKTFSSDVASMQQESKKNYRVIGVIKR